MKRWYELLDYGKERLRLAGITEYELDAWYLLQHVAGISRTQYLCDRNGRAEPEQAGSYRRVVELRAARIPLQQIIGEQEFMGLSFFVNEHVLIPRQDTELLVEEAGRLLQGRAGARVLDLCTGSGCILISLAKRRELGAALGADISEEALRTAAKNARRNQVEVTLVQSDLFSAVQGRFDLIVSNPPYICTAVIDTLEPEVREHEPLLALDGGADGLLFYRRIIEQAGGFLEPGGSLLFEIGHDQGEAVAELLRRQDFTEIRVLKDLAGLDRVCMGKYREE